MIAILAVSAFASVANATVTTFSATTDDRHIIAGHGYFKSGATETFIIDAADRGTSRLTPRVERWYSGKGSIYPNKGVYTFTGTYKIDGANDTTIFQLLNHDSTSTDVHMPLSFTTVFPGADSTKWYIYQSNSTSGKLLATVSKTSTFTVKLQTDGTKFKIWINGALVVSSNYSRLGTSTSMRYGAYHHGKGLATVHVTNALFQLDSNARM